MNDLYQKITDRILLTLQIGGVPPWVQPWSQTAGNNRPVNAATRRPYSGVNVVLLMIAMADHGWTLPRFMTFQQAKAIGASVRAGERGTGICFFKHVEADEDEDGYAVLRSFTVFNVAQIDGLPDQIMVPDAPKPRHRQAELIEEFVTCTRAFIFYDAVECPSYYFGRDDIRMLPRDRFNTDDDFQTSRFHELVHWTGHASRLNRDLRGKSQANRELYAAEELVAELGAAFLCAEFDIDGYLQSASYIAHWIEMLQRDKRVIFTASSAAQKAVDYLRGLALVEDQRSISMLTHAQACFLERTAP